MDTLMIVCSACGATNRVPGDKVAQGRAPVCGKCKTPLPVGTPQPVTDASFVQDVEHSPVPGIPTLLVLKGGREVDRLVGVRPKQEIMGRLETVIA
jgi:hypothetical protein